MPKAVMFISFKLAAGKTVPDFVLISKKVHSEFISKQKGYISWKQLRDGERWVDLLEWETIEDAQHAMAASEKDATSAELFPFIDEASMKIDFFSVENDF